MWKKLKQVNTAPPFLSDSTELTTQDTAEQVIQKACQRGQETLGRSAQMLDAEQVEQAAKLLMDAKQVLILGQGNHAAVAMMTWAQFAVTSAKFRTVNDSHWQTIALSTLSKGDVVLYFSYTGATLEIMDAVEIIRQVGAKLILVTRFSKSPAAKLADVVLRCGSNEGPFQFGSVPARVAQLIVVDLLFQEYCHRNAAQCEENIRRIAAALSGKHV